MKNSRLSLTVVLAQGRRKGWDNGDTTLQFFGFSILFQLVVCVWGGGILRSPNRLVSTTFGNIPPAL